MAKFIYKPEKIKNWQGNITNEIMGEGKDGVSLKNILASLKTTINELVGKEVWEGSGAKKAFDDFVVVYTSVKKFGDVFSNMMTITVQQMLHHTDTVEAYNTGGATTTFDVSSVTLP